MSFLLIFIIPLALTIGIKLIYGIVKRKYFNSGKNKVSSAIKNISKASFISVKIVIRLLRISISFAIGSGILSIVITLTIIASVIFGYFVYYKMSDNNDYSELASNNKYAYVNREDITQDNNYNSIKTLSQIDQSRLNFKLDNSNHTPYLSTKVARKDFTNLANLLAYGENSFVNSRGDNASKYIGYMFGGYHYLNYELPIQKYIQTMASSPNLTNLIAVSTELDNVYYAGLKVSENKTIFMDCSGFVAWYYATLFTSIDGSNENLDTLANWFYNSVTSSNYIKDFNCERVAFNDLKPGDLLVRTYKDSRGQSRGHVGIVINKDEYIHASTEDVGIIISKVTNGSFANSSGYRKDVNATGYRPKIKFYED